MNKNLRRNYFIDKSFQTRFILKFCVIVVFASVAIGAALIMLSENSTTVAIENTQVSVRKTSDFIFPIMIQTIIIVTIFSAIAVSILSLFASHKIAGPLFRLRREIEKLGAGNLNVNFNIREGDQLKNLAAPLAQMACSLKSKIEEIHIDFIEVGQMVEGISDTGKKKQLEGKLKDIEAKLSRFKGS